MEEWWRATDHIFFCEKHSIADALAVVQNRAMGQAGSFGQRCCSGGELDIDYLIRMKRCLRSKRAIPISSIKYDGFKIIEG